MGWALRDGIDVCSDDSAVPNGHVGSHLDVTYNSGIGGHEEIALIADFKVVEVHYVAGSTEGLAESTGGFQSLGREELE